jgi:hypothetical protein
MKCLPSSIPHARNCMPGIELARASRSASADLLPSSELCIRKPKALMLLVRERHLRRAGHRSRANLI